MEPAQPSSPDSPGRPGEFLRREWQQRPLNVEVGEFKEKAPGKRHNLLPLLKPANDFFYPQFVRMFYQNLKFHTDNLAYLSSTVLGQQVYVSIAEIATTLDFPSDDPRGRFGEYPLHCDLHFIINDIFGGVYGDDRSTCAKIAQLPPHLLLVDIVLKNNVYPLGHKHT